LDIVTGRRRRKKLKDGMGGRGRGEVKKRHLSPYFYGASWEGGEEIFKDLGGGKEEEKGL